LPADLDFTAFDVDPVAFESFINGSDEFESFINRSDDINLESKLI